MINFTLSQARLKANNPPSNLSNQIISIREDCCLFGLEFGYKAEAHHLEWIDAIVTNASSLFLNKIYSDKHLRICAPRDSGKTTWGAIILAWIIGHNPNIRIIIVSYTDNVAIAISVTVKRLIESQTYLRIFPEIRKDKTKWSDSEWRIERNIILKDPTVLATGINGSIASRRADLIYIDDPIKSSLSIENYYIRQSMVKSYYEVLKPCLTNNGRVICMATRYRTDDIHSTTFNEDNDFDVIIQKAILLDDDGNEFSFWESHHSLESLQEKRDKDPKSFSSQYQNEPLDETEIVINEDWIIYTTSQQDGLLFSSINIGIDLAGGDTKKSDYNAAVAIGKTRLDTYIVLDSFMNRNSINQFALDLVDFSSYYLNYIDAIKFYIESVGYQVVFKRTFKEIIDRNNYPFKAIKVFPKGNKKIRLMGVSTFIETGKTTFRRTKNNLILTQQLTDFGSTTYDDMVDAFVYCQSSYRTSFAKWNNV